MPASRVASSQTVSMVSFKADAELHPKFRSACDSKDRSCFGGRFSHALHPFSILSHSAYVIYVSILGSTTIQLIALSSLVTYFSPEVCRDQH